MHDSDKSFVNTSVWVTSFFQVVAATAAIKNFVSNVETIGAEP